MGSDEGVLAVAVFEYESGRYYPREPDIMLDSEEVAVYEPVLALLKMSVEQLQHLPADQLIVTVHHHINLFRFAVLVASHAQIVHGSHLLLVLYDGVSLRGHFLLLLHEFSYVYSSGVSGGIVDEDNMVVGVFLHEDGVHVVDMPVVGCVVEGGDHDAEGQLFVLADLVFLFVVGPLSFNGLGGGEEWVLFGLHPAQRVGDLIHLDACIVLIVRPIRPVLEGYLRSAGFLHFLPVFIVQGRLILWIVGQHGHTAEGRLVGRHTLGLESIGRGKIDGEEGVIDGGLFLFGREFRLRGGYFLGRLYMIVQMDQFFLNYRIILGTGNRLGRTRIST